jgi:hypothetical protein
MSRFYEMEVTVTGILEQFVEPVIVAVKGRPFNEEEITSEIEGGPEGSIDTYMVHAQSEFNLCGGEAGYEFAKSLASEIRENAKQPVKIEIRCTYLDDPPTEFYTFEPGDEL